MEDESEQSKPLPYQSEDTLTYLEQFWQETHECFDEMKYLRERGMWF